MVNSGKAFSIALALTASSSYAQLMEIAAPESVGFSSVGLEAVTANLQEHVNNGDIAGVVAAVARDGKIVYYEALGMMDIEQVTSMREDALFRIYSHDPGDHQRCCVAAL